MVYRCVATSVAGFVQQLAVAYVANGYWFYVTGRVPDHKDPATVDAKIIRQYGIAVSKWTRTRRKRAGQANLQYLRYDRFFVIMATHGRTPLLRRRGETDSRHSQEATPLHGLRHWLPEGEGWPALAPLRAHRTWPVPRVESTLHQPGGAPVRRGALP